MRQNALHSSIKSLIAETFSYPIKQRANIDKMPGRMSIDKTAHGNPPIIANDRMRPTTINRARGPNTPIPTIHALICEELKDPDIPLDTVAIQSQLQLQFIYKWITVIS